MTRIIYAILEFFLLKVKSEYCKMINNNGLRNFKYFKMKFISNYFLWSYLGYSSIKKHFIAEVPKN